VKEESVRRRKVEEGKRAAIERENAWADVEERSKTEKEAVLLKELQMLEQEARRLKDERRKAEREYKERDRERR
jgi:hypothetical protein